jgi:uncharacterized protein YukE
VSPVKYQIIHKKIHPPEADALADSYGKAARIVLAYTDDLGNIVSELDSNWEGEQKNRFLDSFQRIFFKSREYAVGTLQEIEKRFRTIQVEIEEQVPVLPQ